VEKHCHYYSLQTPSVNEGDGVINGVSLIKTGNADGHFDRKGRQEVVDETTLQQVFAHCKQLGSVKVKADHGSGVFSTIGWVDNFGLTNDKVLGDFHIYENEPQRARLLEIASKNPSHMGMSLEFEGEDEPNGDQAFSRCERILAVALVSDPAANSSLFSIPEKTITPMEPTTDEPTATPSLDDLIEQVQEMRCKYEELSNKMQALEVPVTPPEEVPAPIAVDPELDPAKSDPEKTYENADEAIDTEKVKIAEMGALRAVKLLSAQLGITSLGRPGSGGTAPKIKTYSEIVESETARFDGNKVKAEAFVLSKIGSNPEWKKAYESHRQIKHS
jgi:hypothetical protein